MFSDKVQKQEGGENSSNIQAQTVNVNNGISYRDARDIALDVFQLNFIQLKNEAAEVARQRAEEITDKFLEKLHEKTPEAIQEFKQPSLQDALYNVQKEFAKSGDQQLGDLLVNLLIDRANIPARSILQVVLDEALKTAPKLTVVQLDLITLNFLFTQLIEDISDVSTIEKFRSYLANSILVFSENLKIEDSYFNYIVYSGCAYFRKKSHKSLEKILKSDYKGLFQKGFTKEDFLILSYSASPHLPDEALWEIFKPIMIPCLSDLDKFQINCANDNFLKEILNSSKIIYSHRGLLMYLYYKFTMNDSEVRKYLVSIERKMGDIFNTWDNSLLKKLELTSVDIAIAHANYRRRTGQTLNLSEWIE